MTTEEVGLDKVKSCLLVLASHRNVVGRNVQIVVKLQKYDHKAYKLDSFLR